MDTCCTEDAQRVTVIQIKYAPGKAHWNSIRLQYKEKCLHKSIVMVSNNILNWFVGTVSQ